jgi:hypothetical protein
MLLALLSLPFVACDNNVVSRAEYDAVVARADSLEAQNDSLQFELSDLKLYNEYLEKTLDTLEHQR